MTSTKRITVDSLDQKQDFIKEAARILSKGGLVIIPTETVYGIAADVSNKKAIEKLYEIKKRPKDKPFSLLVSSKNEVEHLAKEIPIPAYKLMEKFWPGPLTLILNSKDTGSIGLRMPDNEVALKIIAQLGSPVACPSANLSGKAAPVNFEEATKDLIGLVDMALDAGQTRLKAESSIVDLSIQPYRILRVGAIKKEEIESALNKKIVLFICTGNSCRSVMASALLEHLLKRRKREDVEVLSAGIMMLGGLSASESTRDVLKREGIDVSGHRSQRVTEEMLKKSDLILVMEKLHEEKVLSLVPEVKNRLFLLKEFAKISDNNLDIADPIGQTQEFYEKTYEVIKGAVERVVDII